MRERERERERERGEGGERRNLLKILFLSYLSHLSHLSHLSLINQSTCLLLLLFGHERGQFTLTQVNPLWNHNLSSTEGWFHGAGV
jgi:hypothetical protein